ncbi:MAG: hypothetical protein IKG27_03045 [Bacilli bacterium]|nr:hypothetical protein [Bacilli bacterium]
MNNNELFLIDHADSIALIESDRIRFLTENNGQKTYESVEIEGLPKIPVIVYQKTTNNNGILTHELSYKFLIPNINLPSLFTERYINNNGKIRYESIPNVNNSDSLIIFDNEGIHTVSKILKITDTTIKYVTNHKRQIYEFAGRIKSQMDTPKTKTLK